jgi:hypothetical protein
MSGKPEARRQNPSTTTGRGCGRGRTPQPHNGGRGGDRRPNNRNPARPPPPQHITPRAVRGGLPPESPAARAPNNPPHWGHIKPVTPGTSKTLNNSLPIPGFQSALALAGLKTTINNPYAKQSQLKAPPPAAQAQDTVQETISDEMLAGVQLSQDTDPTAQHQDSNLNEETEPGPDKAQGSEEPNPFLYDTEARADTANEDQHQNHNDEEKTAEEDAPVAESTNHHNNGDLIILSGDDDKNVETTSTNDGQDDLQKKPAADPYYVPTRTYRFKRSKNEEPAQWALDLQNTETTFTEVIKTLTPQEHFHPKLTNLRKAMQGISLAFDKATRSYNRIHENKDFVHKCVDIHPKYEIPFGAELNYPDTLFPIYEQINAALAAKAATFRKEATELIHMGHRTICFQFRLDRIHLLFTHLVSEIGQYHAAWIRAAELSPAAASSTNLSDEEIATTGVHSLLTLIDLEMLSYLDINRAQLIQLFEQRYTITPLENLLPRDKTAAEYVTKTILSYIKIITCNHFKGKLQRAKLTAAKALVTAKMENAQAKGAMAATDAAIKSQPLPPTAKILNDAITEVVDRKLAEQRKRPPNRTPNAPNKRPKLPNDKAVDKTHSTSAKPRGSSRNNNNKNKKQPQRTKRPNKPKGKQQRNGQK